MKNTKSTKAEEDVFHYLTDEEIVEVGNYNNFTTDENLSELDEDFFNADDEDFENAGGRRKGCKELGLKGKKLRQCAKDLKKSGYSKGGEIPEPILKKYAPQLVQEAAASLEDSGGIGAGTNAAKGLAGGLKKALSKASSDGVSAVSETSASEGMVKMSTPKKAAIGIGVLVVLIVGFLVIRRVTAAKAA